MTYTSNKSSSSVAEWTWISGMERFVRKQPCEQWNEGKTRKWREGGNLYISTLTSANTRVRMRHVRCALYLYQFDLLQSHVQQPGVVFPGQESHLQQIRFISATQTQSDKSRDLVGGVCLCFVILKSYQLSDFYVTTCQVRRTNRNSPDSGQSALWSYRYSAGLVNLFYCIYACFNVNVMILTLCFILYMD